MWAEGPQPATLADRYRAHVEVPCARPEELPVLVAPPRALGLLERGMRGIRGTDHASFDAAGVPGFYCIQDPAEYRKTHHSQSDTFDKAWKDDLIQGAQVLAVWVYNVAQLPDLLPRKPPPPQRVAGNQ